MKSAEYPDATPGDMVGQKIVISGRPGERIKIPVPDHIPPLKGDKRMMPDHLMVCWSQIDIGGHGLYARMDLAKDQLLTITNRVTVVAGVFLPPVVTHTGAFLNHEMPPNCKKIARENPMETPDMGDAADLQATIAKETKVVEWGLFAERDIEAGEELTVDYATWRKDLTDIFGIPDDVEIGEPAVIEL